ncbi:HD-GYP domain-containing protein [Priestia abyssalis]|uniref:HD-GYP domain-containing protein n=1 Tax=Priestia abyssalis TaxID=1221450 RepID=UPI000994A0A1|nr:HD-GYP domain-containing protein [Priestia abyssalis]
MRRMHISQVQSGDVLGSDIYGIKGQRLLHKGTKLTSSYLSLLWMKRIDYVYIDDKYTHDIQPYCSLQPAVRKKAVSMIHDTITKLLDKRSVTGIAMLPCSGIQYQQAAQEIVDNLMTQEHLLIPLSDLVLPEGHLFHHAINVATIAGIIGMAKGYSADKLLDLGVGALLFDIGMSQIPASLWNKRGKLTETELALIQEHTVKGFEILRRQRDISLLSAHCALQHHERYDGSGYPRQLKKDDIHEYAQIVGLADTYAALTSTRSYRKRYSPQEAAEYLAGSGNTLFDHELVQLFFKHVPIYPIASVVVLNSGETAVVAETFSDTPLYPIVRVIKNPYGETIESPYEIDLRTEVRTTIVEVLS